MRASFLAVALAFACSPTRSTDPAPVSTPPGDSASPAPADTATPPHEVVVGEVAPRARVVGLPGMEFGVTLAVIPAYGGAPATLLVGRGDGLSPRVLALGGDLPPGEHVVTEVWDGTSGVTVDWGVVSAGDVDDDGVLDVWVGGDLVLGPLVGRLTDPTADAIATASEVATFGGFDADGDGHEDAMFQQTLRYGPFAGALDLSWGTFDPSVETYFEGDSAPTVAIVDHLGPGHPAVAVGGELYDPMQPRGSWLTGDDAIAHVPFDDYDYRNPALRDVGDLDGDGWRDVLAAYGLWSEVYAGPVAGDPRGRPVALDLADTLGRYGMIAQAVGDLNADGRSELLVLEALDEADMSTWRWLVLFSPYDRAPEGLLLGDYASMRHPAEFPWYPARGWTVADLDGDGVLDLVRPIVPYDEDAPAGELAVWYGADLQAAWVAAGR